MQVGEKLREKAEDSTPRVWLGHVKERKKAKKDEAAPQPTFHTRPPHPHRVGRSRERAGERGKKEKTERKHKTGTR